MHKNTYIGTGTVKVPHGTFRFYIKVPGSIPSYSALPTQLPSNGGQQLMAQELDQSTWGSATHME